MSKKLTYLLGILLIIIIGSILNWFYCCNSYNDIVKNDIKSKILKSPTELPFKLEHRESNLLLISNDNFDFIKSESNYQTPISSYLR